LESKKAQKIIDKILGDLDQSGIVMDTLIEDLKELREFTRKEQQPLLVKVLRLTYEHLEANDTFAIPIPDDEPIEDIEGNEDEPVVATAVEHDPVESLSYLVALYKDYKNKMNILDLRAYRDALNNY